MYACDVPDTYAWTRHSRGGPKVSTADCRARAPETCQRWGYSDSTFQQPTARSSAVERPDVDPSLPGRAHPRRRRAVRAERAVPSVRQADPGRQRND
eukprot:6776574-Prymnesium_polylepis.1